MPEPGGPQDRARQLYERGATTVYACRLDPRFCFCLHVPPGFDAAPQEHVLVVSVHGSLRTMAEFRDFFSSFADAHRCVVLAPLFPVGPAGDDNGDGFKNLIEGDIRYDLVMLAMIDQAAERMRASFGSVLMFGFSGGAQFAQRFLLVHPDRLMGASIAAPGSVTLIDDARDYWVGTRDLDRRFSTPKPLDLPALRRVPVQLLVGGDDLDTWEIDYRAGSRSYMDGINDAGATRVQRLDRLRANLEAHGLAVEHDVIAGVQHDGIPLVPFAQAFFSRILEAHRAARG